MKVRSSNFELLRIIAMLMIVLHHLMVHGVFALMLDLRTDFSLPCKLIAEEHFLYDSIFTRI